MLPSLRKRVPHAESANPRVEIGTSTTGTGNWMLDFANHLGKTQSERDPNAGIKIVLPSPTPEVQPDTVRSAGYPRRQFVALPA